MNLPAFLGIVVGLVFGLIALGVGFYREVEARNQQTAAAFKDACESTGGKVVWNFKYLECLK